MDGTAVPMVPAELTGRKGNAEDGKARTREVKLAVCFTQTELDDDGYAVRDPGSSSYLASPGGIDFTDDPLLHIPSGTKRSATSRGRLGRVSDKQTSLC